MNLKVKDGKVDVLDLIEHLRLMKPKISEQDLIDFDKAKSNDAQYCIEFGIIKTKYQEGLVYDRFINELFEEIQPLSKM